MRRFLTDIWTRRVSGLLTPTSPDEATNKEYVDAHVAHPAARINKVAHGLVSGDALYFDGTDWSKARSDSILTVGYAVCKEIDIDNFEIYTNGVITGLSGLIPGSWYFVSNVNFGGLTTVEPASGFSNPLGVAISATEFLVIPMRAGGIDVSIVQQELSSSTTLLSSSSAVLASQTT